MFAEAFGDASLLVGAGAWVVAQAAEGDGVQGVVGAAVASSVEAVPAHPSGAGGDGCGAAEVSEGRFGVQPVGVVAGGGEQLGGDVGADAE